MGIDRMSRRRITFTFTPLAIPLQKEASAMSQQPLTTRQERLDISCAVGIVAVLLLLLGFWLHGVMYATPAAAEPPATMATQAAVVAPAATLHADSPAVTTVACDDCDPDEGEQVDAAELAELAAAPQCEEDQPCWDCKTMGNGVCGPLPPCLTEESGPEFPPCFWDAQQRSNGKGYSFIWTGTELIYSN